MTRFLGKSEIQFFAYIQSHKLRTIRTGDLVRSLGLREKQERELLSRMSRKGLIARVRRGLYLVPERIPPGGKWSPSEVLALTTLIKDQNGKYQISGQNAFNRYGWDEQIPNRIYAYNNIISGERKIGTVLITLIKVAENRLGASESIKTPEGIDLIYSSKARALIDAVYDWSRFNTLPRAYEWLSMELKNDKENKLDSELVDVCIKYGNQGTIRRLGYLLKEKKVQESLLRKLEKELQPSSSFIPWSPNLPKRGKTNKRWGIVVNYDWNKRSNLSPESR